MHLNREIEFEGLGRWTYCRESDAYEFIGDKGYYQAIEASFLSELTTLETWYEPGSSYGLAIQIGSEQVYWFFENGDIKKSANIIRADSGPVNFRAERFLTFDSRPILVYELGAICFDVTGQVEWHFQHNKVIRVNRFDAQAGTLDFYELDMYVNARKSLLVSLENGRLI